MALEPGRRSVSPDSSGRNSPAPRQWRNQLGHENVPVKDKHYRKYASGVDRALTLFDTALEEWADYISFLNRLLKALQARPSSITTIPAKATVAKRLSQCLTPSLPSGVHQKALEVYNYVFSTIGKDGLSKDLPLYLPGIASTLSFASLSVRTPFLDILERHFVELDARSLRPALKSIILALLPGLEDETAEDFERTLKLVDRFKASVRAPGTEEITEEHSVGDDFFWQCFFLASITGVSRRAGALAYLVRSLPKLGEDTDQSARGASGSDASSSKLAELVTSPEPGLLLRCFAAGLADDQLLIQRGYLDLLVTHLPLRSKVLQTRVKGADLELLLRAAAAVTLRRDMSLNRRLWTWLLGPEPASQDQDGALESPSSVSGNQQGYFMSRTTYFEEYGLQPLTKALLAMIKDSQDDNPADKARPYRICLSLMDRWEIGGLVVPEVFLPIVDSVRRFKSKARSKTDFTEVVRSASVFFDGVESGLIYNEILRLMAQAIVPGSQSVSDRNDKLDLVSFIMTHFNIREEEMITVHAPLTALAVLCMLDEAKEREMSLNSVQGGQSSVNGRVLAVIADLLEIIPDRAFPLNAGNKSTPAIAAKTLADMPNVEILKKIKAFYLNEQGNLEAAPPPFVPQNAAELLLQKASTHNCGSLNEKEFGQDMAAKSRIFLLLLSKIPHQAEFDVSILMSSLHHCLSSQNVLPFSTFSSALTISTHLHSSNRITTVQLSELVDPLVRHAWVFLSASEPKYHVETVRNLWVLQTALTPQNRDIEAAICSLMLRNDTTGIFATRPAESGRSFTVLWAHSLQDNPSGADRRGPKTPNGDLKAPPRLAGMDNYDVMLTRPLLLMLDALVDDGTQLFMTAKSWLNGLIGTDKVFKILILKLLDLPVLRRQPATTTDGTTPGLVQFTEDDDLDLALYYLRALSNVLRWAPDAVWGVLARKTVSSEAYFPSLSQISEATLQEFFGENRITQLYRCALTVLQQLLLSPYAEPLSALHLETLLIDRLTQSLQWPDPYIQVLLLDVVFASLKLRETLPVELPMSPTNEKQRTMSIDHAKGLRSSVSSEQPPTRHPPPPPTLLKCIQAGLSSPTSRPVLDSWVNFMSECLPLYTDSIFQVLIPLVETFCAQIDETFSSLKHVFRDPNPTLGTAFNVPENTLISLLNGLEQVLARGHDRLLAEEARAQVVKSPDQPQGFFGNMVSGVFSSDAPQSRSATANDRLTVLLAFQDAVRICFTIWSWGQGRDSSAQDATSAASFTYTSLRMRNRARRLLEHLFAAETLECLETVIGIWRSSLSSPDSTQYNEVLKLLPALDGSRPRHTVPALFNAIYSRTNPGALDPSRRSTLTIELQDTDIVIFLVDYAQTLEDDSMDEIWQDCMTFLRDLLGNPFPHRQTLPSLLEFAAILGEKADNTNFGEQRKMRRELADLFLRLLTAIFTTRPSIAETSTTGNSEKRLSSASGLLPGHRLPAERADDVVGILSSIVPNLPKILVEPDRVLTAATAISTSVIGPALRSKSFPDTVSKSTLVLLQELSRLPNNQKSWKKDVGDVFNDGRFFGSNLSLIRNEWLPLLRQWIITDKDRLPEIVSRIAPPTTAGIVFGVGATSARLEADRKTQLNLRRIATLILASAEDTFVTDFPTILDKLVELMGATSTSSPSSTTRAEVYMVVRALVLRTSPIHLAPLWPIINAELHAAISSVVAADHSTSSDTYNNASVLQACKLLDLLVCVAPDDFQLHEWLFVTDTIDAVYRPSNYQPVALVDELSEELGSAMIGHGALAEFTATVGPVRRTLLGPGGISDEVSLERKDELVAKILRPFFSQLSIFAFESTYAMGQLDWEGCIQGLLKDIFDERSIVKAL
ncbi:Dopey, N-terminal-domain-containing protein [Coniochaeta sp. 2T2.1]|nr:Dopey, N-terminal-domain-containing protein [Coniochaeta sp. 2T2.1]